METLSILMGSDQYITRTDWLSLTPISYTGSILGRRNRVSICSSLFFSFLPCTLVGFYTVNTTMKMNGRWVGGWIDMVR